MPQQKTALECKEYKIKCSIRINDVRRARSRPVHRPAPGGGGLMGQAGMLPAPDTASRVLVGVSL